MYGFLNGSGLGASMECTCASGFWSWAVNPSCWANSMPEWQIFCTSVGVAPAPTIVPGTVSTLPAGTQDNAQGTVDTLLNQQTAAQQAANAANITPVFNWGWTPGDSPTGACAQTMALSLALGVCDSAVYLAGAIAAAGLALFIFGRHK